MVLSDPLPPRADAVVVGGGLAGVSAAWFLARAGLDTLLLEARTLASGATGRGTGLITLGLGEPYSRSAERYGRARVREVWRFTRENHRLVRLLVNRLSLRCGYAQRGGLRVALDPREARALRESLPLLRRDGFRGRPYSGPLPEAFAAALQVDGEGLINPGEFVRGLARAAEAEGAALRERVAATALRAGAGGVRVATSRGEVRCGTVVAATSARLGLLLPRLARAVAPCRSVVSEVPFPRPLPHGTCRSGDFYWRPAGPARLLVGGPSRPLLRSFLRRAFPRARPIGGGWVGAVDWGTDGFPTAGPVPGSPRILACAGFCGTGFGYATLAAKLCADIAAGRRDRVPGWMAARRW
ncbi:MAG: FAD-binding oxidoreductase [Halobacteria archaeon]